MLLVVAVDIFFLMAEKLDALNKWRIDQFRRNNKPDKSPDRDFVCLSPKSLSDKEDDSKVVFLSDSDKDTKTNSNVDKSGGLLEVKKLTQKNGKKRRKRDIVCAKVSDDSDEGIIVERPRRRAAKRPCNILKALPLKPIRAAAKQTAVVVPITKQTVCSQQPNDLKPNDELSKPIPSPVVQKNDDLNFIDETVNSPCSKERKSSPSNVDNVVTVADSDSDLSLFEVSFNKDLSNLPSREQEISNPPPSPVNQSTHIENETQLPLGNTLPLLSNDFNAKNSDEDIPKRRGGKGKQPANKRRKVVTKSSRPSVENSPEGAIKNNVEIGKVGSNCWTTNVSIISPPISPRQDTATQISKRDKVTAVSITCRNTALGFSVPVYCYIHVITCID